MASPSSEAALRATAAAARSLGSLDSAGFDHLVATSGIIVSSSPHTPAGQLAAAAALAAQAGQSGQPPLTALAALAAAAARQVEEHGRPAAADAALRLLLLPLLAEAAAAASHPPVLRQAGELLALSGAWDTGLALLEAAVQQASPELPPLQLEARAQLAGAIAAAAASSGAPGARPVLEAAAGAASDWGLALVAASQPAAVRRAALQALLPAALRAAVALQAPEPWLRQLWRRCSCLLAAGGAERRAGLEALVQFGSPLVEGGISTGDPAFWERMRECLVRKGRPVGGLLSRNGASQFLIAGQQQQHLAEFFSLECGAG